jgi:hypothetical protein
MRRPGIMADALRGTRITQEDLLPAIDTWVVRDVTPSHHALGPFT